MCSEIMCLLVMHGSKKVQSRSSRTSRFSLWASNVSFSLTLWVRDQASRLPTKSLKEQSKTDKQNLSATCPRASWNSSFSNPVTVIRLSRVHFGEYRWVVSNQMTNFEIASKITF